MNLVNQLDDRLFLAINHWAGRWPWLDGLARLFLNDYFVPTLLAIILLALWFEGGNKVEQRTNQRAVLTAALSAALANIILKITNLLYYRPRPFALHQVNMLTYQPTDSSLPSNAAALGFAIAAGVWFYNRAWGWTCLTIAAAFGVSRIFGGVHFPLDVITGAALGWGAAWLVRQQARQVDRLLGLIVGLAAKLGFT